MCSDAVGMVTPKNNMKQLTDFFCRSAMEMAPYSPIEPPDQIAKRLGLPEDGIVKLDANENPFGTSNAVLNALTAGKYYHIYPDPAQVQLREAISQYTQCSPEMIVAGAGADELIDLTCRLLLEPGEKVLSFGPSFSYYPHVVSLNKGVYEIHDRESDFSISLEACQKLDLQTVKLVILTSPNNPTANILEESVLDYFLEQDIVVMVDEAYYEFSKQTYRDKIDCNDNLIILRTFSKCFGLAGLRVGYGLMSPQMADAIMRIKPPYSVNVAAEVALKTCLDNLPFYQKQVGEILKNRAWTLDTLGRFEQLQVFPSQSNFILCRVMETDAGQLFRDLEKQGILVRYFSTEMLKNYIRISIGTHDQMERLIEALRGLIK